VFRAALGVLKEAPGPMSAEYGAVERSLADHRGKTVEADDSRPRRWSMLAD
jgi:hypothetical protein